MQSFHVRQLFNNYKHQEKKYNLRVLSYQSLNEVEKNTLIIDKINISSGCNVFGI